MLVRCLECGLGLRVYYVTLMGFVFQIPKIFVMSLFFRRAFYFTARGGSDVK